MMWPMTNAVWIYDEINAILTFIHVQMAIAQWTPHQEIIHII